MKNKALFVNKLNKFISTSGKKLANKFSNRQVVHIPIKTSARFKLKTITEQQLISTINSLKNTKSHGFDNLTTEIIKENLRHLVKPIWSIVNKCLEERKIADGTKVTKISPVFKGDHDDCANYRPICLLPIINKILEKIANNQLLDYLEENQLLCSQQFGFRQKSNTVRFHHHRTKSTRQKNEGWSYFPRYEKSIETVDWKILLKKLNSMGIIGQEHEFFQSYFTNRRQFIETDGMVTEMEDITTGVAQGANLAATLFLIHIDDINEINLRGYIILYADDIVLVIIENSIEELQKQMNENCTKIHKWMTANKLTLNTNKTNYLLFRSSMNEPFNFFHSDKLVVFAYFSMFQDGS